MKMKWFLFLVFLALIALSIVATMMIPSPAPKSKTSLSWVTDPNPQRDPQIEAFNRLYPDCHLSIDPDNTGITKVVVQCSAGMGPDLIDGVNETTIQTYVDAGILWDLTDVAQKHGFGLDTLPPSVRPLVQVKALDKNGNFVDRQFAYPSNVYHSYLFYNKNIFDKYHVPYPPEDLTWDEYIKIAQKLTIYHDKGNVLPDIFGAAGVVVNTIIWEMGGDFFNEAGTVATVNTKAFLDAYSFFKDLYYKYHIEPSPTQKTGITSQGGHGAGYINWFGEGKVAMLWGSRWNLINLRRFIMEQKKIRSNWLKDNPNAKPDEGPQILRFGCVLVPRFNDGPRYTQFGARCTAINAQSKNREKALNFLQFLAGPEYSRIINAGADSKPGNQKYISLEQFRNPDYPGEDDAQRISIVSIPFGRDPRRSPFVNNSVVVRIMKQVSDKIVSDPNLSRKDLEALLQDCSDKINLEIARNIKRNNRLQHIYEKLLKQGEPPIKYNLKEIN